MYPILLRLGGLTIYACGFFLAIGFIAGWVLAILQARKEGIAFEIVADLFFHTVLSAFTGIFLALTSLFMLFYLEKKQRR